MKSRDRHPTNIPNVIRRIRAIDSLSSRAQADSITRTTELSQATTSRFIQDHRIQRTFSEAPTKLRKEPPLSKRPAVEGVRRDKCETLIISEPYDPRHVNADVNLERFDRIPLTHGTTFAADKEESASHPTPSHSLRLNPLDPKLIVTPPQHAPAPTQHIPSSSLLRLADAAIPKKHIRRNNFKHVLLKVTEKIKPQSADSMARSQQASACQEELAQLRAVCENLETENAFHMAAANRHFYSSKYYEEQFGQEKAKVAALNQILQEKAAAENLNQQQTSGSERNSTRPEITDLAGEGSKSQKVENPGTHTPKMHGGKRGKPRPILLISLIEMEDEVDEVSNQVNTPPNVPATEVVYHELPASAADEAVPRADRAPEDDQEGSHESSPATSHMDLRSLSSQEIRDQYQQEDEENEFRLQVPDYEETYGDLPYDLPEFRGSSRDIFSRPESQSLPHGERTTVSHKGSPPPSPTLSRHSRTREQGTGAQRAIEIVYRSGSPRIVAVPAVFRVPLSDTSGMPPPPAELMLHMGRREWDTIPELSLDGLE